MKLLSFTCFVLFHAPTFEWNALMYGFVSSVSLIENKQKNDQIPVMTRPDCSNMSYVAGPVVYFAVFVTVMLQSYGLYT